jgi:hypothetical protein
MIFGIDKQLCRPPQTKSRRAPERPDLTIQRSEVATIRQRLFIWLLGLDLQFFWPMDAITAP